MNKPLPATMSRFRTVALLRLARFETGWLSLASSYNPKLAATLVHDLHLQVEDARAIGAHDVVEVSAQLEKLLAAADRRRYVVPPDIELLVTMAIQLLGILIRGERNSSVDVRGFVRQIDEAVDMLKGDVSPRSVGERGSGHS
jgi:hypothetical protein